MTLKAQVLRIKDLPYFIEIRGDNGESIIYQIKAAGRKFGASLDKVDSAICKLFRQ
jgi:hypothetical protein